MIPSAPRLDTDLPNYKGAGANAASSYISSMPVYCSSKRIGAAMIAVLMLFTLVASCSANDRETAQLIVKFKESATQIQRDNLNSQIGAQKLRTIFGDTNAQVVRVSKKDVATARKIYEQSGLVKYVEGDVKISIPANEK